MLVPFIVHISYLLREGWWHGVGHHWWWWRLLLGLWGRRLGVEWEWWVVHTILSGPLHTPKLRGTLEALVTKAAHLVCRSAKITLSIAVAVIAATIVTTRVTTIASIVATILGLTATKGALRPTAKPSVAVPVATTTEVTPPTPRIPIPAIILVATSSPPSTTSSVLCHLDQLGVNGLVGLAEHRDQVTGLFHVVGGEEGVGCARFLTSGCASNAVDIILGRVRVVIIDDKFHILHICESVAVWQNKTRRPQRILHTTTARSKGKISNWEGWGRKATVSLWRKHVKTSELRTSLLHGNTTVGREKRCTLQLLTIIKRHDSPFC